MRRVLLPTWQYLRAFLFIYLCLYVGTALSSLLPVKIPGSIIGMLVLFLLLALHILPVDWVKPGCSLLIRYMTLLFVPASVGIMNHLDLLSAQFGPIIVSNVLSTIIVLITTSSVSQLIQRQTSAPQEEKHD